jgi:Poly-gamma-glutamate hydrolase
MIEDLSEGDAKDNGELIELLTPPNSQNRKLIVIAPHGGNIEPRTDEQAEHVRMNLPSECVTTWICKGLKNRIHPKKNIMHVSVGILLQPKSAKDRSPSLGRLFNRSLNMQLPFMEWRKISSVSVETPKAPMLV